MEKVKTLPRTTPSSALDDGSHTCKLQVWWGNVNGSGICAISATRPLHRLRWRHLVCQSTRARAHTYTLATGSDPNLVPVSSLLSLQRPPQPSPTPESPPSGTGLVCWRHFCGHPPLSHIPPFFSVILIYSTLSTSQLFICFFYYFLLLTLVM